MRDGVVVVLAVVAGWGGVCGGDGVCVCVGGGGHTRRVFKGIGVVGYNPRFGQELEFVAIDRFDEWEAQTYKSCGPFMKN